MELHQYNPKWTDLLEDYYLPDGQLYYSATPKEAIEISKGNQDRHDILGLDNGELVVFFVLHENEGASPYTDQENSILIRSFSTNYKHQGKGYAKESLKQLPAFVKTHLPHIENIVLAVNVNNTAAQHLYKKCGYKNEGVRVDGSKGELIVMSYRLN